MRLEARAEVRPRHALAAAAGALLAVLALVAALLTVAGAPVGRSLALLAGGAFGSVFALSETFTRAVPLMLTGLAATAAFRARLFNIGAEGQLYAGAMAAVAVGGVYGELFSATPVLGQAVMFLAAALTGALLLLGPALARQWWGVDEVVCTLLLNFIVLLGVGALLDGPMKDPGAMGWPQSVALASELELDKLLPQTRVHTGLLLALACAVALWALLRFTTAGFQVRALGANARAAAFVGVPVTRTVVLVALLSGGLAGLAGAVEVAGRTSYVTLDMSPGYGYSGVVIAMLAGLHPLAVVASAVGVAAIIVGADSMGRALGVPSVLADVVVAATLLAVLAASMLTRYRLRFDGPRAA
ncbi:ABC transporter permease [Ideonella sp. DXS22W]|uniref:ABC transporter permease n=1 Tax=Pseudaquabacterium inlustre TaxID=2984192 RepID=A0ABU9CNR1_9BURK